MKVLERMLCVIVVFIVVGLFVCIFFSGPRQISPTEAAQMALDGESPPAYAAWWVTESGDQLKQTYEEVAKKLHMSPEVLASKVNVRNSVVVYKPRKR